MAINQNTTKEKGDSKEVPLIKCLTECSKGEEVRVIVVNAGFNAKRRLAHLGIIPGAILKKKRTAPWGGPVEISVKGSDLVLGRGLAAKITVRCDKNCIY